MSGEVPQGWEPTSLCDQATIVMGQSPRSTDVNDAGAGIPFLQGNAEFGPVSPRAKKWIEKPLKVAEPGDVLFSVRAPVGEMNRAAERTCIGRGLAAIRADAIHHGFLFQTLFHHRVALRRLAQGSTFDAINGSELRGLQFPLPPFREQQRIADILTSVDDAIQATEAVIEQTKKVKQGVMNRLLTKGIGHTKFKQTEIGEIPEGWEVLPAEALCETVIDCKNRTPPVTDEGYAVVRTPNVRDGRFVRKNLTFTDEASFKEWTKRGKPGRQDILITREAPVGEVCAAPADIEFCLGQRMMLYRPDPMRMDQKFMLFALQGAAVQRALIDRAGGSTVGHVRVGDIRTLPVPVPSLSEQRQIAQWLEQFECNLEALVREMQMLTSTKRALSSDLLTGRRRVSLGND